MNFWPRWRLTWRMVIWVIAPMMKRKMKTPRMGPSSPGVGVPPSPARVGGYGLRWYIAWMNELVAHKYMVRTYRLRSRHLDVTVWNSDPISWHPVLILGIEEGKFWLYFGSCFDSSTDYTEQLAESFCWNSTQPPATRSRERFGWSRT